MKTSLISTRMALVGSALLVLAMVSGCKDSHSGGHDHDHGSHSDEHDGHDHGDPQLAQISVWTNGVEIFVEHRAPVAGKPTQFITHITDLNTFEPRREGAVKFSMRQGEKVAEHRQAAPAREGIYLPGLTFPSAGTWRLALILPTRDGEVTADLGDIKVHDDAHDAAHAEFPEAPEGITYLKEQQWKGSIRIEAVTRRRVSERIRASGVVMSKPGHAAHVTPPLSGTLQPPAGGRFPMAGDRVAAGQALAVLQPAFSEATAKLGETEGEIARARLEVAQARRDFERIRKLVEAQIESTQNLELAKLALESAEAQLAARLATRTSYQTNGEPKGALPVIELKSPIAGVVVSTKTIALGQHVTAETPVFEILDATALLVEARVREADMPRLTAGTNALAEFAARRGEWFPLTGEAGGRLVFISPEVDEHNHTIQLLYELPNPTGRLRVGEHLTLFIEGRHAEDAIAIPDSAIVEEAGQPVAFVQVSGETFAKRELTLGLRDGGWVQVLRGLKEGERVVTHGAMAIRLASTASSIPDHGHVH